MSASAVQRQIQRALSDGQLTMQELDAIVAAKGEHVGAKEYAALDGLLSGIVERANGNQVTARVDNRDVTFTLAGNANDVAALQLVGADHQSAVRADRTAIVNKANEGNSELAWGVGTSIAAGLAGAAGGAWLGAKGGAAIGAMAGAPVAGAGAVPGAIAGGVIGAAGGAIGGFFVGIWAGGPRDWDKE